MAIVEDTRGRIYQAIGVIYLVFRIVEEAGADTGFTLASIVDIVLAPFGWLAIAFILVPYFQQRPQR